jgi:hypothetical protein
MILEQSLEQNPSVILTQLLLNFRNLSSKLLGHLHQSPKISTFQTPIHQILLILLLDDLPFLTLETQPSIPLADHATKNIQSHNPHQIYKL